MTKLKQIIKRVYWFSFEDRPIATMIFLLVALLGTAAIMGLASDREMLRKVHSGELELYCAPYGDHRMEKVPANVPTSFLGDRWRFGGKSENTATRSPTCITRTPEREFVR